MGIKFRVLFGLVLLTLGCDDDNIDRCMRGTVIGYEQCSNAVLIQVADQHQIGGKMTYYDNVVYNNVVRAPGEPGQSGSAAIYFTCRPYNKDKDAESVRFTPSPCFAIYGPFDVPTVVVTGFSANNCSDIKKL